MGSDFNIIFKSKPTMINTLTVDVEASLTNMSQTVSQSTHFLPGFYNTFYFMPPHRYTFNVYKYVNALRSQFFSLLFVLVLHKKHNNLSSKNLDNLTTIQSHYFFHYIIIFTVLSQVISVASSLGL